MTTDLALFGTTVNEVQDLETLLATVSETTENIENEDKSNVSMYFIIIKRFKEYLIKGFTFVNVYFHDCCLSM